MPLEPASSPRPWVAIYSPRSGFARVRSDPAPAEDLPPTYDEVMSQDTAQRRLPASHAIPLEVANEPPAWRSHSAAAPAHPATQARELQKLLDRRARTQRKLDVARENLETLRLDHALRPGSFRNFCGGGLFDDSPCVAEAVAQREVEHYEAKKQTLLQEHMAMLSR